jgi:glycosyltransferase involved in cell wall biosynthesis
VPDSRPTIIIPAHNEEAVIGRTLSTLLRDAAADEFDVVVVCNGCSDATANLVRRDFPEVVVRELDIASKTAAINEGLRLARGQDALLLDADIEIGTVVARDLLGALSSPGVDAAIGRMLIDVEGGSRPVQAFYRVWACHPYLSNGKFAAAIALSRRAVDRIGALPDVIADDTYLRRQFAPENVAVVAGAAFRVRVPRSLPALIRVRCRVHRGNAQLDELASRPSHLAKESGFGFLREIFRRPKLWLDVPSFLFVGLAARLLAVFTRPSWQQDLTSRQAVSP